MVKFRHYRADEAAFKALISEFEMMSGQKRLEGAPSLYNVEEGNVENAFAKPYRNG